MATKKDNGLRAAKGKVVVSQVEAETISAGGIHIPTEAQHAPERGWVVNVGPARTNDQGQEIPAEARVGDMIIYPYYGGRRSRHMGENYVVLNDMEVLATVNPDKLTEITPLQDLVLCERGLHDNTHGKIIISGTRRMSPYGKVRACGPGRPVPEGEKRERPALRSGDVVLLADEAGTNFTIDKRHFTLLREVDILAEVSGGDKIWKTLYKEDD